MVDCVFVVDTTGSMDEYLAQSTVAVETLVQRIKEQTKSNDVSLRFGFVSYTLTSSTGLLQRSPAPGGNLRDPGS